MKLPNELTEERDFMSLYRMAIIGTTDIELMETIIALAYMKGQASGMGVVRKILREDARETAQ